MAWINLFSSLVVEPKWFEIGTFEESVSVTGMADRSQLTFTVPAAQSLGRDTEVARRLIHTEVIASVWRLFNHVQHYTHLPYIDNIVLNAASRNPGRQSLSRRARVSDLRQGH